MAAIRAEVITTRVMEGQHIDANQCKLPAYTIGEKVKNVRLHLTVLPQVWHDRPKTRADCLSADALARALTSEWLERHPEAGPEDAPHFQTSDGMNCARPCPYVGCKHHLLIEVNPDTGDMTKAVPFDETSQDDVGDVLSGRAQTCSLDVANEGAIAPKQIGALLNVSRQRVEFIAERGVSKARRKHQASQGARQAYPWRRGGCD